METNKVISLTMPYYENIYEWIDANPMVVIIVVVSVSICIAWGVHILIRYIRSKKKTRMK